MLTTAKKSTQSQRKLKAINSDHRAQRLFIVRLLTWDDIERIVDRSVVGQEALAVQAPGVIRDLLRAELQPYHRVVVAQDDQLHGAELDDIKRQLDENVLQLAALLLARLRNSSWDRLSPRHKYRWCTLSADVQFRQGNKRRAAQWLLEAKSHCPDDVEAVANEIVAYDMLGDRPGACRLATTARALFPNSGHVYAAAIRVAASADDFMHLVAALPKALEDDAPVCIALATRMDLEPQAAKLEERARRATQLAPQDPEAWFLLGVVLLQRLGDGEDAPKPDASLADEARACFGRSASLSRGRFAPEFEAEIHFRMAAVESIVGNVDAARAELERALKIDPEYSVALSAMAQLEFNTGNVDGAVQRLRQVVMRDPVHDAGGLLAIALWNRNGPGDRVEATKLATQASVEAQLNFEALAELGVEGCLEQSDVKAASDHLDRISQRCDPCLHHVLNARIVAHEGHADKATTTLLEAAGLITERTSRPTLRRLARLLASSGCLPQALGIWGKLITAGVADDDSRSYVECAARLEEHARVLEFCATVRAAGVFDDFLLQWELRFLDRYDPECALAVLEQLAQRDPSSRSARLHLVHLALRLGKSALADQHAGALPTVLEADAHSGAIVVDALAALQRSSDAIAYAYDLLRRHFRDPRAHRAFTHAVLHRRRDADVLTVSEAQPGVAVALKEEGSDVQWFVLEDSQVAAVGVDNEIAADSPLARRIVGKTIGATVMLSEGAGLSRGATIHELLPKYVFRFRDCGDRWQYRFPDHPELWVMRVRVPGDDGEANFEPLIELLKHQNRQRLEILGLYKQNPHLSTHLLGQGLRTGDIATVVHLAEAPDQNLRCCIGSASEYTDAEDALHASAEVIVDATALATLFLLDEIELPTLLGKTLIVTPATTAAVREFVASLAPVGPGAGQVTSDDANPLIYVPSQADEASTTRPQRFLDVLENSYRRTSGAALAKLDPADRTFFENGLGMSGAESAVHSASASRVLWTDDYVIDRAGRAKLGFRRVWTQAVLRYLSGQGLIAPERYNQACARLLGWQYMFTSANPDVMRCAARLAQWDPARWPFAGTLAYLSAPAVRSEDAAQLAAHLLQNWVSAAQTPFFSSSAASAIVLA